MGWFAAAFFAAVIGWLARYAWSVRKGARHAPGTEPQWWTPGGGTHGEGGSPPLIVDDDDWDPDRRIR